MARREKNKSYNGLLSNNYGKSIFGNLNGTNEADQGIKSNPLSLVRSGYFQCLDGNIAVRGSNYGNVWTSEIRNTGVSYSFTFYPYAILGSGHTDRKGDGYPVHWGAKIKLRQ